MAKVKGSEVSKTMTGVYFTPRVKTGLKVAAALEHTTVSELVERLCVKYLRTVEGIGDLIEKRG